MKLCVGRIAGRYIEVQHAEAFEDFLLYLEGHHGQKVARDWYKKLLWGDALVERARSRLATWFLEQTDADVLLSIDTDIVFRPEDALRMALEAHARQAVMGALYMTRSLKSQPSIALFPDKPIAFAADGKPAPVRYLSGGFMAVPRAVFEALRRTVDHVAFGQEAYDSFYGTETVAWGNGATLVRLSEDWAFCNRAAAAGFDILIDPRVRLGHVGEYEWRLEDLTRPDREQAFAMTLEAGRDGFLRVGRLPGRSA